MTRARAPRFRHIRIRVGALVLDYVACAAQADDVARVLATSRAALDVSVTIDDDVSDDLPHLPCSGLWE